MARKFENGLSHLRSFSFILDDLEIIFSHCAIEIEGQFRSLALKWPNEEMIAPFEILSE